MILPRGSSRFFPADHGGLAVLLEIFLVDIKIAVGALNAVAKRIVLAGKLVVTRSYLKRVRRLSRLAFGVAPVAHVGDDRIDRIRVVSL